MIHTLAHKAALVLLYKANGDTYHSKDQGYVIDFSRLHDDATIIQKYARRRIHRLDGVKAWSKRFNAIMVPIFDNMRREAIENNRQQIEHERKIRRKHCWALVKTIMTIVGMLVVVILDAYAYEE